MRDETRENQDEKSGCGQPPTPPHRPHRHEDRPTCRSAEPPRRPSNGGRPQSPFKAKREYRAVYLSTDEGRLERARRLPKTEGDLERARRLPKTEGRLARTRQFL